jgi:hypothetical protein
LGLQGDAVLRFGFLSAPLLAQLKTQREQQAEQQQEADHGKRDQSVGHGEAVIHFYFFALNIRAPSR